MVPVLRQHTSMSSGPYTLGRCDAGGANPCLRGTGTYCVMSCEWWSSPLYCDKDHPQVCFLLTLLYFCSVQGEAWYGDAW